MPQIADSDPMAAMTAPARPVSKMLDEGLIYCGRHRAILLFGLRELGWFSSILDGHIHMYAGEEFASLTADFGYICGVDDFKLGNNSYIVKCFFA